MSELPGRIGGPLLRLARRLGAARDAEQVLRGLLDDAREATGADAGAVYRWDVGRRLLVRVSATPPPPSFADAVRPGEGPIGAAAERRRATLDGGAAWGLRSVVAVPLVHGDELCGALVAGRRGASAAADLDALDALAGVAAPIVALLGLAEREAATRARLEALTRAARDLAHDLNNDLTLPIGAIELLRDREDLPPDAAELIAAAGADLARVEGRIRAFQQLARGRREAEPLGRPSGEP